MATALLILALSSCTAMATTITANNNDPSSVRIGSADEHSGGSPSSSTTINSNRLRGSPEHQQEATQPQHVSKKSTNNHPIQQSFAQNMLTNQGCPPTSSCGDVCYVLTVAAASDLHSVAVGTTNRPSHHWHEPSSFWRAGICNAKAQCVSVNPFDKSHTFNDLASTLANVERECERSVGMASMFLLAKAMDPTTRSCDHGVSYPNALV
uniref:Uncharacterized protein n=1 Tax=Skeletonema marinoi TaxID=267567 RepID=A0A7S2KXA6_9STRA